MATEYRFANPKILLIKVYFWSPLKLFNAVIISDAAVVATGTNFVSTVGSLYTVVTDVLRHFEPDCLFSASSYSKADAVLFSPWHLALEYLSLPLPSQWPLHPTARSFSSMSFSTVFRKSSILSQDTLVPLQTSYPNSGCRT